MSGAYPQRERDNQVMRRSERLPTHSQEYLRCRIRRPARIAKVCVVPQTAHNMRWRNIDAYRRSKIHTAGKTIVFRRPHELYCARVKVLCPHSKTISDQADRGCNGGPVGVAIIVRQQNSHSTFPQAVQMFSNTIRTLEGFLMFGAEN